MYVDYTYLKYSYPFLNIDKLLDKFLSFVDAYSN